jgi:hypothetical protein
MGSEKLRESGLLKPEIEIKHLSCHWFTPLAELPPATVTYGTSTRHPQVAID